jgi:hypothetical protein
MHNNLFLALFRNFLTYPSPFTSGHFINFKWHRVNNKVVFKFYKAVTQPDLIRSVRPNNLRLRLLN